MTGKIRVDTSTLNGHDYIAIEEATGQPIGEVLTTARGIYAVAWRCRLADDPTATFEDTLLLSLSAFDMVNDQDDVGKADAANGAAPRKSLASGG